MSSRIFVSLAMAASAAGILASPAQATFHLNVVNEVMLASAGGDSGTQFVEFLDNGGTEEQFTPVFAPYKLIVYDGAGNEIGQQTLDPTALRSAAAADREYLVSTASADAAFGVTGDERLTVSLPLSAGQVCFAGSEPAPSAVSCMTYGAVSKPVPTNSTGTGSMHGPVPPNGESDQRQPNGSVIAAAPTPKAQNHSAPVPPAGAGKPRISGVSLTGIPSRNAKLKFTALAGTRASGIKQISIALPAGPRFNPRKPSAGLIVSGGGGASLRSAARLRQGRLVISLSSAAQQVSVSLRGPSLVVANGLAQRVKQHRVKRLRLLVAVTDAKGAATTVDLAATVR
jgi:hypothetical protein